MFTTSQEEYQKVIDATKPEVTKPRILIVDDNMEFLEELQEILAQSGYDAQTLMDSDRALSVAYGQRPELIILDLKMSPKTGFQVAVDLRNSFYMKDVPIIAMTGFFTEKEHVLMMKLCGIKSFILKPFNPRNLVNKIEFALGNRKEEYEEGT